MTAVRSVSCGRFIKNEPFVYRMTCEIVNLTKMETLPMAITVRDLCFAYKENHNIVNCPEFCFSEGNVYALVGYNGSGKTTFLKILLGLLKPTSGKIIGLEKEIIAFVPDYNGLYESLSVLENIKFRLSLYNLNYSSEKNNVDRLLSRYNLCGEENKLVKDLSLGMKKKVSLICALAVRPSLLVLDEPTGGLDTDANRELSEMIREYISPSTTVICTSHDQEFLDALPCCTVLNFPMGGCV